MKKRFPVIICFVLLLAACAPLHRGPPYQESLIGGFNPADWTVGYQGSNQNQRIIEFVRPGEKIDNWAELLTLQVFKKPANPERIDALVARAHTGTRNLCPNSFVQNVILQGFSTDTEEASIIYEWKINDCPPHADQHEMARMIYGKINIFHLAYTTKTKKLAQDVREKRIRALSAATIVVEK